MKIITNSVKSAAKDQIVLLKCHDHPIMNCQFISFEAGSKQHLLCSICLQNRMNPQDNIYSIDELLDSSSNYYLYHLENNEIMQKLNDGIVQLENLYPQVKSYYTKLQNKVIEAFEQIIEKEYQNINKIKEQYKQQQQILKSSYSFHKWHGLLTNKAYDSRTQLHNQIVKHCNELKNQNQEIIKVLNQTERFNKQFSNENLSKVAKQMVESIQEIQQSRESKFIALHQIPLLENVEGQSSLNVIKTFDMSRNSFIPSKEYKYSCEIQVEYNSYFDNSISIFSTSNNSQQCYLDQVLKNNTNYLIKLSYNHRNDHSPNFMCGLISSLDKDIRWMVDDHIYYDQKYGGSVNSLRKGNNLRSMFTENATGAHELEIHINIHDQLFRVCSPDYQNCQELKYKSHFDITKKYYFAIWLANYKDSVIVHYIKEVFKFPYSTK